MTHMLHVGKLYRKFAALYESLLFVQIFAKYRKEAVMSQEENGHNMARLY
jgi:hypothetical protein